MTGGGVFIDIPQVAYRTWIFQIYDNAGRRLLDSEKELREKLKEYAYRSDHDHVR